MIQQDDLLIEQLPKPIRPRISYLGQLGILLGLVGVGFIMAFIVQVIFILPFLGKVKMDGKMEENLLKLLADPSMANIMRWMQLAGAFCMFFLPVLVTAIIISRKSFSYLGFNRVFSSRQVVIVIGIALLALVTSTVLGELNTALPIPASWAIKFKQMEEMYNKQVMAIAQMHNIGEYIFVMIVIALAPAIFEEVAFRAGLQQLLVNWTKRPLLAIIITSIFFSLVHMSFYGFLPRAALGVVLGLIYYYSKNIWLSVLMHFINNGVSVTAFYIYTKKGKPMEDVLEPNIAGTYGQWVNVLVGIVTIAGLVFLIKKFRNESNQLPVADPINYLKTDDYPFA